MSLLSLGVHQFQLRPQYDQQEKSSVHESTVLFVRTDDQNMALMSDLVRIVYGHTVATVGREMTVMVMMMDGVPRASKQHIRGRTRKTGMTSRQVITVATATDTVAIFSL